MQFSIRNFPLSHFTGQRIRMSMAENKTILLWRNFMPRRNEITEKISNDLFSVQVFDETYSFQQFNPNAEFEKWAAVPVPENATIPDGMESLVIPAGLYAVFEYKGLPAAGAKAFQYIFGTWLPASEYELDQRPHFEILGEKYRNDSPDSEEEIWIPIRKRA